MNVNGRAALRVALNYAFFSGLYILFSDQALLLLLDDPALITSVQSVKGWAFVAISAVLIYLLMMRELGKIDEAEAALNEQKRLLNAVLENSPAVMYMKDADGKFLSVNQRFCDLFHLDSDSLVGKTDLDVFPPHLAGEFRKNDLAVLVSGKTMDFQEVATHADGSLHTYLSVKFPVGGANGQPAWVCGISTDITERVLLEERLQRTERLNALGRLTGGVAHDFNNHLTVIIGCLQMLEDSAVSEAERATFAREASRASFQAASLVDQLLAFARNQILLTQEVDVNESILNMGALLQRSVRETVRLQYDLAPGPLFSLLDSAQLESAILNLAINARDAMPKGGVLTIRTRTEIVGERDAAVEEAEPGDYVCIEVCDTGEGMPPEVLARVLEPFYTTKPAGKGTGLGLSMVDGFARQSKGFVRLESTPDAGTTISILVPALPAGRRASDKAAIDASSGPHGHGERILLVEDEPALRAFGARILEIHGYAVAPVADAYEAMALIDQGKTYDLLFSDVMLPGGMLGPELAQRFLTRYPQSRVLLTSGYAEPGFWPASADQPQPQLLKKPYGKDELLAAVRRLINN